MRCAHFLKDSNFDEKKEYYVIEAEENAEIRKNDREEIVLRGCMKAHVISFRSNGDCEMWRTISDFMGGETVNHEDFVDDNGDDETNDVYMPSIDDDALFALIQVGSFVAIRSHPSNLELFHVMKVDKKGHADENMKDSSDEHCVLKGKPYLLGRWYSFDSESKIFAKFKPSKNSEPALIHLAEVYSTDLKLDNKYQLDINDYRMLVCNSR